MEKLKKFVDCIVTIILGCICVLSFTLVFGKDGRLDLLGGAFMISLICSIVYMIFSIIVRIKGPTLLTCCMFFIVPPAYVLALEFARILMYKTIEIIGIFIAN